MSKLLRILFNAAVLTSLLLCWASVGLWVRSYRYHDDFRVLLRHAGVVDVTSLYGGLQVAKIENAYNRDGAWGWTWDQGWVTSDLKGSGPNSYRPGKDWQLGDGAGTERNHQWLGFRLLTGHLGISASTPFWSIRVPLGFLSVCFAILPTYWMMAWTMRRKRRPGRYINCGYDLRATPDRCPECGTAPTANPPDPNISLHIPPRIR